MQNVKYDYSSVHVDVPNPLAQKIIDWGLVKVTDDDIYVSQKDPSFGREDEIHITILYGLHIELPDEAKKLLDKSGSIKARLGKMDLFTKPQKYDVVIIDVISEDLKRLNDLLKNNLEFTDKYGVYKPHVTVAYTKKNKGWRHIGQTLWEGQEFVCDYAVFSSKDGSKHRITL